jgi:hypothetical protein
MKAMLRIIKTLEITTGRSAPVAGVRVVAPRTLEWCRWLGLGLVWTPSTPLVGVGVGVEVDVGIGADMRRVSSVRSCTLA